MSEYPLRCDSRKMPRTTCESCDLRFQTPMGLNAFIRVFLTFLANMHQKGLAVSDDAPLMKSNLKNSTDLHVSAHLLQPPVRICNPLQPFTYQDLPDYDHIFGRWPTGMLGSWQTQLLLSSPTRPLKSLQNPTFAREKLGRLVWYGKEDLYKYIYITMWSLGEARNSKFNYIYIYVCQSEGSITHTPLLSAGLNQFCKSMPSTCFFLKCLPSAYFQDSSPELVI